jgi:C4-dicarboxylate-specific signal transduction histidine kinase
MTDESNREIERQLMENGLAFFGAITASVSHELNNVISIIYQSAGLLEDLLLGAEQGRPIKNERLKQIAGNISHQTERGVKVIKRLNSFAHSVDDPRREVDINALVENLTALTGRFAGLKKVNLETSFSEQAITLETGPFNIQQVLFLTIQQALASSIEGDSITIRVEASDEGGRISVEGGNKESYKNFDLIYSELLMNRINGRIRANTDNEKIRIDIEFPDLKHD